MPSLVGSEMCIRDRLYTSWKENLLKFENAPFEDLIKKMERWYDVKIIVDPTINTKERYTMTIKTESLREMLQVVSKTTAMKYEIKANIVSIKKPQKRENAVTLSLMIHAVT
eukprot:TRINITY_DN8587_c0_g1_i2.p1 TRINITY_DN8587_c0_g1~~TRINITY_DN8587_c0_g1_i2.p1  ORF type:complete len:112 (-),score=20.12 TRINITY_DN8587_c0_g1_i2:125-460(-)